VSEDTYSEVWQQVQRLTLDEQLRLLADLAMFIRSHAAEKPLRSVLDLEGLGKGTWDGIDAQEYVNQERDSWK
jgi:hypothetical protein